MPAPSNLLKFRPVLTLEQIRFIVYHLQTSPDTDISDKVYNDEILQSIKRVLVPMIAKVEVGAINPAYKLSETHAIKQQESSERQRYERGEMSAEEEATYESKILGV